MQRLVIQEKQIKADNITSHYSSGMHSMAIKDIYLEIPTFMSGPVLAELHGTQHS